MTELKETKKMKVFQLHEQTPTHFLTLSQPGLHKVGIRGIQIRAKFTILGAKVESTVYHWLSEPEIMDQRLTFNVARLSHTLGSQIQRVVLL